MSRRVIDRVEIAIAQESGHAADIFESLKLARVGFSRLLLRESRGLQQQWPSRTQQAIEQTLDSSNARAAGADA